MNLAGERTFTHAAKGFAAKLTALQAAALRKDPSVVAVVPDEKIELTAQVYPTGINRMTWFVVGSIRDTELP